MEEIRHIVYLLTARSELSADSSETHYTCYKIQLIISGILAPHFNAVKRILP